MGFFSAGIAIIMDSSLAQHVLKMNKILKNKFVDAKAYGNFDAIWNEVKETMMVSADTVFSKCWFSKFEKVGSSLNFLDWNCWL
ncbi:hypothetical protein G9A89_008636 [Geosiphon pyriformis]|nr:hypothetical protein G9A89_008636 [Geosiphon pyriformis]